MLNHAASHTRPPAPVVPGGWGAPRFSTGIRDLDELTGGGIGSGELWLLTSAPGQGRSTMLTQLAAQMTCQHEAATWLVSDRDPAYMVSGRLHSCLTRVPLNRIAKDKLDPCDTERLRAAEARLEAAPLVLRAGRGARHHVLDDLRNCRSTDRPAIALFDDPDWKDEWDLSEAHQLAENGIAVVVTLPRRRVLNGPVFGCDLNAVTEWADLVIEVRHDNLVAANVTPADKGSGYGAMVVLRNRRGPTTTLTVAFQGQYARFVDRP